MNPIDYLKTWAHDNPVQYRYLLTALVGGLTALTGAPAELVGIVLTVVGGWAMQSTRKRVTPEHEAQARIQRATALERERHTATVSGTAAHKPAPRRRAPKESGQVWVPFLLGAVCAVVLLLLAGKLVL